MSLTQASITEFRDRGHLTVPGLFSAEQMQAAGDDAMAWSDETLATLAVEDEQWYLDAGTGGRVLRKLDNPVHFRPAFRALAAHPPLVAAVESLLGRPGVSVWFSQIFFKPPEGGGPKPVHQDNAYFGPSDPDGMISAWVAIDDADESNGCLLFAEGSNRGPILPHTAPEDEPFNLQIPAEEAARFDMTAVPVASGGVSFHHGATLHGSRANTSARWRRAVAFHYVAEGVTFADPAWAFDETFVACITRAADR